MTIRAYTPADFDTVNAWAVARGMPLIPHLLSPQGFLVEDEKGPIAVVWVYLVFDCPIAMLDNLFSRPGTSLAKGKEAWKLLWRTVQSFLSKLRDCNRAPLSYKIIRIFTHPALVRFLEADGWNVGDQKFCQALYVTPP